MIHPIYFVSIGSVELCAAVSSQENTGSKNPGVHVETRNHYKRYNHNITSILREG